MKFKFEKLNIWQKAMDFGEEINILIDKFPEKEKFTFHFPGRVTLQQSAGSMIV